MSEKQAKKVFGKKTRIKDAIEILKHLGFPSKQQNERSALTLLALLNIQPDTPWNEASSPLLGITPMMEFFQDQYSKKYAPNSRETVRRFTVHQFEQAGIIIANPDKPRAVNSPDFVYQIEGATLELIRTFGSPAWPKALEAYMESRISLQKQYAAARELKRIPATLPNGEVISLSACGQNVLIREIIEKFCGYFTQGGEVLYIGDSGKKHIILAEDALKALGVEIDPHGKMPDVIIFHKKKQWLLLVEAVTSHGPVDPKRHRELKALFKNAKVGLVFVTAFLDRKVMTKYLNDISWETEVWIADNPTHLIHFNGERFLGPYSN